MDEPDVSPVSPTISSSYKFPTNYNYNKAPTKITKSNDSEWIVLKSTVQWDNKSYTIKWTTKDTNATEIPEEKIKAMLALAAGYHLGQDTNGKNKITKLTYNVKTDEISKKKDTGPTTLKKLEEKIHDLKNTTSSNNIDTSNQEQVNSDKQNKLNRLEEAQDFLTSSSNQTQSTQGQPNTSSSNLSSTIKNIGSSIKNIFTKKSEDNQTGMEDKKNKNIFSKQVKNLYGNILGGKNNYHEKQNEIELEKINHNINNNNDNDNDNDNVINNINDDGDDDDNVININNDNAINIDVNNEKHKTSSNPLVKLKKNSILKRVKKSVNSLFSKKNSTTSQFEKDSFSENDIFNSDNRDL